MVVWAAGKPSLYLGSFVGRIIVQDDVNIQPVWGRPVDLLQEIEKLSCAVPFVAFADDKTRGNVEHCEQ